MIRVNFKDGQTKSYDLTDCRDAATLRADLEGSGSPDVTSVAISRRNVLHTFPPPINVEVVRVGAELLRKGNRVTGEIVWYDIGDFILRYVAYKTNVTRLDVEKKD
jgi:hypothetical protein